MKEENFADKVNSAFDKGWNSNPQFTKALKEIEHVATAEIEEVLTVEDIFRDDKPDIKDKDDDAR